MCANCTGTMTNDHDDLAARPRPRMQNREDRPVGFLGAVPESKSMRGNVYWMVSCRNMRTADRYS